MNKVILIGNLVNDPEATTTQNGFSRSKFRIAVQRKATNSQGVHEADFFTVIAWRQTADFCNRYLSKGRKIAIEGSIQNRSYEAQDGSKRNVTEIIAESVEAIGSKGDIAPTTAIFLLRRISSMALSPIGSSIAPCIWGNWADSLY